MIYRILRPLLLTLCLCFVLAACSDEEPTPAPTATVPAATATTPAAQAESPLNAPGDSPLSAPGDSPLPTPTSVTSTAATEVGAETVDVIPAAGPPVDPKTTETTGAVTGRIFVHNDQGFRPIHKVIVALAAVIAGDDGIERAAGYDAAAAPRTDIRDDGTFVIDEVPPGRYGVILDAVMAQILITEPENPENSLVITIEAGEVTDLGNLVYPSLALPADSQ